jgi:micrococcal nuclease
VWDLRFPPIICVLLLLLLPAPAGAAYPDASTPYGPAIIHGCYDGDTCTISIPSLPSLFGDRLPIRLAGIDTPEKGSRCDRERALAVQARNFLRARLRAAREIEIDLIARDKYFRVLTLIRADGVDLADALLAAGLAHPYGGGPKLAWC